MTTARVFDSSALLALVKSEPGGGLVDSLLRDGGLCGAANWAEIAQKARQLGLEWTSLRAFLLSYELKIEPVTRDDAERAAAMWREGEGLSLADRLCLALGERLGAEVHTADRAWANRTGVTLIR